MLKTVALLPCPLTPVLALLTVPITAGIISMSWLTKSHLSDSIQGGSNCLLPQLSRSKVRCHTTSASGEASYISHGSFVTGDATYNVGLDIAPVHSLPPSAGPTRSIPSIDQLTPPVCGSLSLRTPCGDFPP